jgi:hypothetical protein
MMKGVSPQKTQRNTKDVMGLVWTGLGVNRFVSRHDFIDWRKTEVAENQRRRREMS